MAQYRPSCPQCGNDMAEKIGRHGPFLSCIKYPQCKGSADLPQRAKPAEPRAAVVVRRPSIEQTRSGISKPAEPRTPVIVVSQPHRPAAVFEEHPHQFKIKQIVTISVAVMGLLGTCVVGLIAGVGGATKDKNDGLAPAFIGESNPGNRVDTVPEITSPVRDTEPIIDVTPECPNCGKPMVARNNSKTGKSFWGCTNFPKCRGTREIED